MALKVSCKLSGVKNDPDHSGKLSCNYLYITSDAALEYDKKTEYSSILFGAGRDSSPILFNYTTDASLNVESSQGLVPMTDSSNYFSFYRREYNEYTRMEYDKSTGTYMTKTSTYRGPWEPVAIHVNTSILRDFNVAAGHSYQYIIYPDATDQRQQFANNSDLETSHLFGAPVKVQWGEWSLTELIPVQNEIEDAPIVKKTYKADLNNVWLFKYALETGAQTQNMDFSEVKTLGRFPRIHSGNQNYMSGDVSCYLGSEIVPYSKNGYVERLRNSIKTPLSTNERVKMLQQWRSIASSKNPKLLRDMKGQAWIVRIMSSSNTPKNFYPDQPDIISFSWRQIDDPSGVIIYGAGDTVVDRTEHYGLWEPKY